MFHGMRCQAGASNCRTLTSIVPESSFYGAILSFRHRLNNRLLTGDAQSSGFVDRPAGCGYHRRYLAGGAVIFRQAQDKRVGAWGLPRCARNEMTGSRPSQNERAGVAGLPRFAHNDNKPDPCNDNCQSREMTISLENYHAAGP